MNTFEKVVDFLRSGVEFDVASANSFPTYYDLWALRTKDFDQDCWGQKPTCFEEDALKKWFPDNDMSKHENLFY